MNLTSILPFIVLLVGIYLVSSARTALAGYALFRPPTSLLWAFERVARGFQIAMITLFVIGLASTEWKAPPDLRHLFTDPPPKEPPHVIIQTEFPPTAISAGDPLWLQREKRRAMLDWEAKTWRQQRGSN